MTFTFTQLEAWLSIAVVILLGMSFVIMRAYNSALHTFEEYERRKVTIVLDLLRDPSIGLTETQLYGLSMVLFVRGYRTVRADEYAEFNIWREGVGKHHPGILPFVETEGDDDDK